MNEDPVFYKKLSRLIRETIEDYHRQRIDEAEFLKRAKEQEASFLRGHADNIPEVLKDNETGISIYNLTTEVFEKELSGKPDIAATMALGIDHVIRSVIFDKNQLIVDWHNKPDMEGRIKIAIDDYLFDLKMKYDIALPFDDIDKMIEEALSVAKAKFVS